MVLSVLVFQIMNRDKQIVVSMRETTRERRQKKRERERQKEMDTGRVRNIDR